VPFDVAFPEKLPADWCFLYETQTLYSEQLVIKVLFFKQMFLLFWFI
jgi:hypothetical protein